MSQTSRTSTNKHLTAINHRTNLARNGGEERVRMWGEPFHRIPVSYLADIESHAEALAARVEEREAQLRLIAPVVSAALEMFQWEGSTDYPDGDPEVIKRRRAFRDALYHLDDLHYDELDFLDDFQPGDLPNDDGSNGR